MVVTFSTNDFFLIGVQIISGIFTVVFELKDTIKKDFEEFEKVLLLFSIVSLFLLLEVLFKLSDILVDLSLRLLFYISQVPFFRGSCRHFDHFDFFDNFRHAFHSFLFLFLLFLKLLEDSFFIDLFVPIGDLDILA